MSEVIFFPSLESILESDDLPFNFSLVLNENNTRLGTYIFEENKIRTDAIIYVGMLRSFFSRQHVPKTLICAAFDILPVLGRHFSGKHGKKLLHKVALSEKEFREGWSPRKMFEPWFIDAGYQSHIVIGDEVILTKTYSGEYL